MLIRDIYDSNVNGLISDLQGKLSKAQLVRRSAEPGGDYEETLTAYIRTLHATIDALTKQAARERAGFAET